MVLSLLDRIRAALTSVDLDRNEFEQRAMMLLKDIYPTLVPIAGGTDFGRDGDARDDGATIRFMATTGSDVARNLRTGLVRLEEEDEERARVVVATSQPETARLKRRLQETAADHGSELVELHGRQWLAAALHDHPEHRLALLGITGDPPALVPGEVVIARLGLVEGDLIGREEELAAIAQAADNDVLLVGRAGAGKSRLAAAIPGALFANTDAAIERIGDDIRSARPQTVVVDDAVRALATLRGLIALREEGLDFRIVATAWPDHAAAIVDVLPMTVIDVRLLERAEGAEVLRSMGIGNDTLIGMILDQAEGRAGWMALLGSLALRGSVNEVIDGVALASEVRRFARRAASALPISRDAALDVLGAVALGGHLPDTDVGTLAAHNLLPRPDVLTALESFTDHGLLDYHRGGYSAPVLPVRAAIVASLLEPRLRLDVTEILSWPWTDAHAGLKTLLYAAHRGASRASAEVLRLTPAALNDVRTHRERETLQGLIALNRRTSNQVVDAIDRELRTAAVDTPAALGARESWAEALATAARHHGDDRALDLLVTMALTSQGGHNDMIRRPLIELAHRGNIQDRGTFGHRQALLDAVARNSDRLTAHAPDLAGQLLAAACSPEGSFTATDPIEGMSLTYTTYLEGPQVLRRITDELWPQAVEMAVDLPPAAVRQVLDKLADWARCAHGGGQVHLGDESVDAAARHLRTAVSDLRAICAESPSLSHMWNVRAEWYDTPHERLDIPSAYWAILPPHERARLDDESFDLRIDREQQSQELQQAAAELRVRGTRDALEQVASWLRDHDDDVELRAMAARLLRELPEAGDASETLAVAITIHGLGGALRELMTRCIEEEPDRWPTWWPDLYGQPSWRDEVLSVAVSDDHDADDLRQLGASLLTADDAWKYRNLFILEAEPGGVLDLLLSSDIPELRDAAAVAFALHPDDRGPAVPNEWAQRWEDAFLKVSVPTNRNSGWRWTQLTRRLGEQRPDLLIRWVSRRLEDDIDRSTHIDQITEVVDSLPLEHRLELLREHRDTPARPWLVKHALGHDAGAAIAAIDAGVVEPAEVAGIGHDERPDEWFEQVAPALLDHGIEAAHLAPALEPMTLWGGPDAFTSIAEYAAELSQREDARLAEIGRVAEEYFRQRAADATNRERERRVRGLQ